MTGDALAAISEAAVPPSASPAARVTAMPSDANPYGDIFGGWLMAQMDLAAGLIASRRVRGRAATVAVDGMTFLRPVAVGDEVSIYGSVLSVGRTSLKVSVEAWRRDRHGDEEEMVTRATFVFVAIGVDRRPVKIPGATGEAPLSATPI
jgi:acyl-CoA thioesterase YciA